MPNGLSIAGGIAEGLNKGLYRGLLLGNERQRIRQREEAINMNRLITAQEILQDLPRGSETAQKFYEANLKTLGEKLGLAMPEFSDYTSNQDIYTTLAQSIKKIHQRKDLSRADKNSLSYALVRDAGLTHKDVEPLLEPYVQEEERNIFKRLLLPKVPVLGARKASKGIEQLGVTGETRLREEELTPEQREEIEAKALLAGKAKGKSALELLGLSPRKPPAAPKTRTVTRGTETVTQEWDETTGKYTDIAKGPRFKPDQMTLAQASTQLRNWASTLQKVQSKNLDDPLVAVAAALNPNFDAAVAEQDFSELEKIAQDQLDYWKDQVSKLGGPAKQTKQYKTKEEVVAAYKRGELTYDEAAKILKRDFGIKGGAKTESKRECYNRLRDQGVSMDEAKKQCGIE